jgi:ketosteroid isomerase-like protein
MQKPKMPPVGSADDTEATFYEALLNSDIDKLMGCWADEDDIVCIHPGGARLIGAAAIRASFEGLFANGSLRISIEQVRRVESMSASLHSLVERIEIPTDEGPRYAYVLATNTYLKTAQGWRITSHHASPGSTLQLHEAGAASGLLH